MKTTLLAGLFTTLTLCWGISEVSAIEVGDTEEQVIEELSQPKSIMEVGDKKVYVYEAQKVKLQDGKVIDVGKVTRGGGLSEEEAAKKRKQVQEEVARRQAEAKANANKIEWLTDYDEAKQLAESLNRPILINFTGSDWCGWCKRLHSEVFSQTAFKEYANESLVLLEVDFPRKKPLSKEQAEKNGKLSNRYKVTGYPTIFVIDSDGNVLLRTGYLEGGAENYVNMLQKNIDF